MEVKGRYETETVHDPRELRGIVFSAWQPWLDLVAVRWSSEHHDHHGCCWFGRKHTQVGHERHQHHNLANNQQQ